MSFGRVIKGHGDNVHSQLDYLESKWVERTSSLSKPEIDNPSNTPTTKYAMDGSFRLANCKIESNSELEACFLRRLEEDNDVDDILT